MRKALFLLGSVGLIAAVMAAGLAATGSLAFAAGEDEKPATTQQTSPDNGTMRTWSLRTAFPRFFARQAARHTALVGENEDGFVVGSIDPDSPLGEAGVVRGDIILAVGDSEIGGSADLHNAFEALEAGDKLTLRVQHGDEVKTVTVTVPDEGADVLMGATPCGGSHGFGMFEKALELGTGANIGGVTEDGPAALAGIEDGERIVSINGTEISTAAELVAAVGKLSPGDKVTLEVATGQDDTAATRDVEITLGAHPDDASRAFVGVELVPGFRVRGLHEAMPMMPGMGAFPVPADGDFSGTFVAELTADGPAAEAGVREGDVIVAIDGTEVSSPQDVKGAIEKREPGDKVKVTVRAADQEETRDVTVTLGSRSDDESAAFLGVGLAFAMRSIKADGGLPGGALDEMEGFSMPFGGEWSNDGTGGPGRMFRFQIPQPHQVAPAGSGTA